MKPESAKHIFGPGSRAALAVDQVAAEESDEIKEGELIDAESGKRYPIEGFIPRFVDDSSYTASFGEQWNRYRRTQIDRFNGTDCTSNRFYAGTNWSAEELKGQKILEVGCGAGRFTQIMLDAGADVYSVDYSSAVDACWANNGPHPRLFVAQVDLYSMPFEHGFFDKVFCYGVLQHTPDVKRAFFSLLPFLKPGGEIAVDFYRQVPWIYPWTSKFWYRPITKRLPRDLLRRLVEWYVPLWLPIDTFVKRVPVLRRVIPAIVPCWNYSGLLPLSPEQIVQWGILDTFDALSPWYDQPQTIPNVQSWFEEAGLSEISVRPGGNGILGNARKT